MLATPAISFQRTPVTLIVTAVAAALELVCTLDPERRLYYLRDLRLGMWWQVWDGEVWRPFTCTLMHGDLLHAAFNIYWALTLGVVIESWLGPWLFLGLFALLAYVSSLAEFVWSNYDEMHAHLVGMSGVVYGLFGFLWAGARWRGDFRLVANPQTVQMMMAWFFACIFFTNAGVLPVANVAHGAGLVMGGMLGFAACDAQRRWAWTIASVLLAVAVLTTLFYCPGHAGYIWAQEYRQYQQYQRLRERQTSRGAVGGQNETFGAKGAAAADAAAHSVATPRRQSIRARQPKSRSAAVVSATCNSGSPARRGMAPSSKRSSA